MVFNKVIKSIFGILAVAVFAAGTIFADSAEANVNESASLRLASTGRVGPQLKAFARLQLLGDQQGGRSLRAAAQVESDGLTENRLYDLWLTTPGGKSVLVDTGRADQEFDESDAGDSDVIVDLRGWLLAAPSGLTTLEGVTMVDGLTIGTTRPVSEVGGAHHDGYEAGRRDDSGAIRVSASLGGRPAGWTR